MEQDYLTFEEVVTPFQQYNTTDTKTTSISFVDTTGVVLIIVPFVVLIGVFIVVIVLCKRRLHRGIKFAKVGKTNHIQMMKQKLASSQHVISSSSKYAPRKTFSSRKEYEMTNSFSKYVWGIQEKVVRTLSAVELKQQHALEGTDATLTPPRIALKPSIKTSSQSVTSNLRNNWYWKAEELSMNNFHHYSPKPKTTQNSIPKRRKSETLERLKTTQSFIDEDGLDEYTTIRNRRDSETLLQERKSLLETEPISYKQFIQHSIIMIEQAAGLCCDLPCNHLGLTSRQIIEFIRDRVGFSQEDCERYLKFFEKSSYSSERTLISEREFELFSSSFLSILQQIDSFYLQTTLL